MASFQPCQNNDSNKSLVFVTPYNLKNNLSFFDVKNDTNPNYIQPSMFLEFGMVPYFYYNNAQNEPIDLLPNTFIEELYKILMNDSINYPALKMNIYNFFLLIKAIKIGFLKYMDQPFLDKLLLNIKTDHSFVSYDNLVVLNNLIIGYIGIINNALVEYYNVKPEYTLNFWIYFILGSLYALSQIYTETDGLREPGTGMVHSTIEHERQRFNILNEREINTMALQAHIQYILEKHSLINFEYENNQSSPHGSYNNSNKSRKFNQPTENNASSKAASNKKPASRKQNVRSQDNCPARQIQPDYSTHCDLESHKIHKKLTRKIHPDKNPGCVKEAEIKFKHLTNMCAIINPREAELEELRAALSKELSTLKTQRAGKNILKKRKSNKQLKRKSHKTNPTNKLNKTNKTKQIKKFRRTNKTNNKITRSSIKSKK